MPEGDIYLVRKYANVLRLDIKVEEKQVARKAWRKHAACAGMDPRLFFPMEEGEKNTYAEARIACKLCSVRQQCFEDAVETRDFHGFRAGLRPKDLEKAAARFLELRRRHA